MLILPIAAFAALALNENDGPLEPSSSDPTVTNAADLFARLNTSAADTSLRLVGHIGLGALTMYSEDTIFPWISGRRVTLWSTEGATLDAEGVGRHFTVSAHPESHLMKVADHTANVPFRQPQVLSAPVAGSFRQRQAGQLLIQGIHLTGGRGGIDGVNQAWEQANAGGCVFVGSLDVEDVQFSRLIARNSTFSNCSTSTSGGAVQAVGSAVEISDSIFEDCEAVNPGASGSGNTRGGGLGLATGSRAILTNTRFVRTRSVSAGSGRAYGGGVGLWDSVLTLDGVHFINTSAEAAGTGDAYGGGLGAADSAVTVTSSSWEGTRAISPYERAYGGGLGTRAGGLVTVYDSEIRECNASGGRWGAGGGVGSIEGGRAELFNVTITDSIASHPDMGVVLYSVQQAVGAATLTIHQRCNDGDSMTRLLGTNTFIGLLLLRNLSVETSGCTAPILRQGSRLLQCDDEGGRLEGNACGPRSICTTSNDTVYPTPLCTCRPPTDLTGRLALPAPSPNARRAELAPYTDLGCVGQDGLTFQQWVLNPNRWRASDQTSDVRACVPFWQPGAPTPCRGGDSNSTYCGDGLRGPLCRVCVASGQFYQASSASCVSCPITGGPALLVPILICFAIGGGMLLLHCLCKRQELSCAKMVDSLMQRAAAISLQLRLMGKLKLVVGYFQVVHVVPEAFRVTLPHEYTEWMRAFDWLSIDWLTFAIPPECIGPFAQRLRLQALLPLFPLLVLFCAGALNGVCKAVKVDKAEKISPIMHFLHKAADGVVGVLPVALLALFALVPSTCARIFSTFSCQEFGSDDSASKTVAFLNADFAVECFTDEHHHLKGMAAVLILLWPIGVPALFWSLLVTTHSSKAAPAFKHAVRFLYNEYIPRMYWWEMLEQMRKLTLSGFVFLIPPQFSFLRLVIAIIVSFSHIILLMAAEPYVDASTAFVAVSTSVLLQCTLLVALLVKMYDELDPSQVEGFFGFDSVLPLAAIIFSFNVLALAVGVVIFLDQLRVTSKQLVRVVSTGLPPTLSLAFGKRWHLFLSHQWASQDPVATVKRQLQLLLPGVVVFLDMDGDLESIDKLEYHVAESQAMLVFLGSPRYFGSKSCLRELGAASANSLPLILVHDSEVGKGGAPLAEIKEASCSTRNAHNYDHSPSEYHNFVFDDRAVIPWHRHRPFQLTTLRRIAEQLLLASPAYSGNVSLVLPEELTRKSMSEMRFFTPIVLCISGDNAGAEVVAKQVEENCSAKAQPLLVLNSHVPSGADVQPTHFLLYLNSATFDNVEDVANEVRDARANGLSIILVWETDLEAKSCPFNDIMAATPADLVNGDDGVGGLYETLAIPWCTPPYRDVSIGLVAEALQKRGEKERARAGGCSMRAFQGLFELVLGSRAAIGDASGDVRLLRSQGGRVIERTAESIRERAPSSHGAHERHEEL